MAGDVTLPEMRALSRDDQVPARVSTATPVRFLGALVSTAYVATALVTVAANAFSGFAAMTRLEPIMRTLRPALPRAGVPESWLIFPIGMLRPRARSG